MDVIHAVLFLCGDGDGTAHSGKMILKTGRSVSKYAGEFDIIYQNKYVLDSRNLQVIYKGGVTDSRIFRMYKTMRR